MVFLYSLFMNKKHLVYKILSEGTEIFQVSIKFH